MILMKNSSNIQDKSLDYTRSHRLDKKISENIFTFVETDSKSNKYLRFN